MLTLNALRGPKDQSSATSPSGSALISGAGAVVGIPSRNSFALMYASGSIGLAEHQPVLAPGIGSAVSGQFVTGAIVKAQ